MIGCVKQFYTSKDKMVIILYAVPISLAYAGQNKPVFYTRHTNNNDRCIQDLRSYLECLKIKMQYYLYFFLQGKMKNVFVTWTLVFRSDFSSRSIFSFSFNDSILFINRISFFFVAGCLVCLLNISCLSDAVDVVAARVGEPPEGIPTSEPSGSSPLRIHKNI